MRLMRSLALAVLLFAPALAPAAAQVNPAEADILGFGPQVGDHVFRLPDGRRLAVSTWDLPIGLSGAGLMVYEFNNGGWLWNAKGWCYWWQAWNDPAAADDQKLPAIIAENGGEAKFIIHTIACASLWLVDVLGFNPTWAPRDMALNVSTSLHAWKLRPVVKSNPGLLVLPYPPQQE